MAYVLLAIGALMSLAGAIAAVNGYGIIQVEQGWASVIAGVTLFVGGIVTIALALVLRALGQLQLSRPAAVGEAESVAATREPAFAPAYPPADVKTDTPVGEEPYPATFAEPVEPHHAPATDLYAAEVEHAAEPFTPAEPAALTRSAAPTTSPPLSDDWFDRAFAELDQPPVERTPVTTRTRKTETLSEVVPSRARELAREPAREPAFAVAEPEPPLQAEPEPAPASAIIGRYEADETSYIMYADGSIEAQTQSGVYRFASMAELKAFIES